MEDAQAIKRKLNTYKAVHLFLAILAGAALGIGYYTGYNKGYEEGYFLGAWHSELYYEATGKFGFTACTPSEEWALKNMHRRDLQTPEDINESLREMGLLKYYEGVPYITNCTPKIGISVRAE